MNLNEDKKYHYFYKITNNLNNHYYYGIHSTSDLDDGYMGSGKRLHYAYKKYGIENFTKDILKFFNTRKEAAQYEAEIVNEVLIKDEDCYNIIQGGEERTTHGTATVKDHNGTTFQVPMDDPRILSGELVGVTANMSTFCNKNGDRLFLSCDDSRVLSGEYISINKGLLRVRFKNDSKIFTTTLDDERLKTGEIEAWNVGMVLVKDVYGKCFVVKHDDIRLKTGELSLFWKGRKHRPETIKKSKETYKQIGHQQGEKNSQFGTCWITKDGINKKIKKEELDNYILDGWINGRLIKNLKN